MSEHQDEIDIKVVEVTIEQAQATIKMRDTLTRLLNNDDFNTIISEGYFQNEAAKLVMLRAAPEMQDPEMRAVIDRQLDSIGYLRQHFLMINAFGRTAEKTLADNEETMAEILIGDTDDGED